MKCKNLFVLRLLSSGFSLLALSSILHFPSQTRMISPFTINIPQEKLEDLKNRLKNTRWPDAIENSGWKFGADINYMKELHDYWLTQFDWRKTEAEVNSFDNFIAGIDENEVHFIYEKGSGKKSIPIIISHGWPGSFLEMIKLMPLLTKNPEFSFDVIVPSLPGFGFSSKSIKEGVNVGFMADLLVKMMKELGYEKFAVQGGDFGAGVSTAIAYKYPDNVIGIHLNYIPGNYFPEPGGDGFTDEETAYLKSEKEWYSREGGYSLQQKTKPLTLSYGLNDSPMGLCAWIVEKMYGWADCRGNIENVFTKDELLSNVSLYWLTETIHSSVRLYYENSRYPLKISSASKIKVPAGIARFALEEPFPPRSIIERGYNIQHWTDFPDGGHFAAMEKPAELANDIRKFYLEL